MVASFFAILLFMIQSIYMSYINGGNTMLIYKAETLTVSTKWFSNKANENDISELDELLNERATEG